MKKILRVLVLFLFLSIEFNFANVSYVIHLGAFSNQNNAISLVEKLKENEIGAVILFENEKWVVRTEEYYSLEISKKSLDEIKKYVPSAYIKLINDKVESQELVNKEENDEKNIEEEHIIDTNEQLDKSILDMAIEDKYTKEYLEKYEVLKVITSDINLNKTFDTGFIKFNILNNEDLIDNPVLEFDYDITNLKQIEQSSATIKINGTSIRSYWINNLKIKSKEFLEIPKNLLKSGENNIEIKIYQKFEDSICEDNINPAHWFVIKNTSKIYINENKEKKEFVILDFPKYLNLEDLKVAILLENVNDKKSLASAYELIQVLAKQTSKKVEDIIIDDYKNINKYKDRNIIVVNSFDDNNSSLEIKLEQNSNQKIIYFSGNVSSIKNVFENEKAVNQMNSDKASIVYNDSYEKQKSWFFSDLGYGDFIEEDKIYGENEYFIQLPAIISVKSELFLNIKTRYIPYENGSITIYFDGNPTYQFDMKNYKEEYKVFKINIPKEYLEKKKFNLKIKYQYDDFENPCEIGLKELPFWFVISNESYISGNIVETNKFKLDDFGAPFMDNQKNKPIGLVINKFDNLDLINAYKDALYYLAKKSIDTSSVFIQNTISNDNNQIWIDTDENIMETDNEFIDALLFNKDTETYYENESVPWVRGGDNGALISELYNKNSTNNYLWLIRAENYNDLNLIKYFETWDEKIEGNAIIANRHGIIEIRYDDSLSTNIEHFKEDIVEGHDEIEKNKWFYYAIILWIILLIVISISIYYFLHIRKNKRTKDLQNGRGINER